MKRQSVVETGSGPASTRNCSICVLPMQRCCAWLPTVGAIGNSDCVKTLGGVKTVRLDFMTLTRLPYVDRTLAQRR
ncbi:hypothetical protein BVI434_410131 [Burkholderia vietnamiensis]|nr:hypothetical protein BVI434_410131 [Burkholderia vietnamiensis]